MMDTKYRVTDLRDLQTKMMQDFLKMEVDAEYPGGTWRTPFYNEVKRGKDSPHAVSYEGAWKVILEKGIDTFSFDDLDITAMTTCLKHLRCFSKCEFKNMSKAVGRMQDSRNYEAHMNSNENFEELYAWISATIYTLRDFVYAADKNAHADESVKDAFVQKYLHKINDIDILAKADLESYYGHKGVLKRVQRIKNNKSIQMMINEFHSEALSLMRATGTTGDWSEYAEFVTTAAEEGIEFAYSEAASLYFQGRGVEKDYLKSEYYCRKQLETEFGKNDINVIVILASLYINGLSDSETPDYGWELLGKYKDSYTFEQKENDGIITFEHRHKR